jgi:hypothetical protein
MKYLNMFLLAAVILLVPSCEGLFTTKPEAQLVQVYLKYGFNNELNTFEKTLQKDLVADGIVKTSFWFTAEEQNAILEKANKINFFSLPDTLKYVSHNKLTEKIFPDPGPQILRIKTPTQDKTVLWTYPSSDNPRMKDLLEINKFIQSLIEAKPAYKKLPPRRGGYI